MKAGYSMAYRALYREWRPKDFSHVVGQKAVIETLRNQVVSGRIAHAYLFCGSRGTGKTSTAKILAKAINCEHPSDGDPCGECPNCVRADREETLDVIEIDAASNNGVDEIRELRETVKYPPQYGRYKVYIIDEVHMLSPSAFNALLKTLEEPPEHIVFILATTEPQKLPDTILSRCQRFDFGRISISEIAGRLKEAADGCGATVSDGALMMIARSAEGGMRDALSLLDMCLGYRDQVDEQLVRSILGTSDESFLFDFSDAIAEADAGRVFRMIDLLMRAGKDPSVFAKDMCRHIRALLIASMSPEDLSKVMDITNEEALEYRRHAEGMTVTRLMTALDVFMSLDTEMRYASAPRIALENASIKCCLKIEGKDEQALLDRITELERKMDRMSASFSGGKALPVSEERTEKLPSEESGKAGRLKENTASLQAQAVQKDEATAWKEMLSAVQRSDIALWSFLSQGTLLSASEGKFLWQANRKEGEATFITALNKPEKREEIIRILTEKTGRTCEFAAVSHNSSPVSGDAGESGYLENIYETFGKGAVHIVE